MFLKFLWDFLLGYFCFYYFRYLPLSFEFDVKIGILIFVVWCWQFVMWYLYIFFLEVFSIIPVCQCCIRVNVLSNCNSLQRSWNSWMITPGLISSYMPRWEDLWKLTWFLFLPNWLLYVYIYLYVVDLILDQ